MGIRELDRPLEAEALREIEGTLRGKLKAVNLSDSFIERCVEDALQKGLVEYLRAIDKGVVVDNRDGFVVRAAFCRAIDELRREARHADGAAVDVIIDSGGASAPPTDEVAIDYLQAEQLRAAIKTLSPEEQQVLRLHYFEELTTEASAKALFCSERTYRRRLKRALKQLGRLLDAPVPEPGSELAIEIGVVLWVGLRGASVALAQGPLEQLVGVAHAAHAAVLWIGCRTRDLAARMISSGASEKIAAFASGPGGKAAGACLGTVAACVLAVGGVELIGGGTPAGRSPIHRDVKKPTHSPSVVVAPRVHGADSAARSASRPPRAKPVHHSESQAATEQEATEVVRSQEPQSVVEEAAPEPSSSPSSSSSTPSPTEVANSQFGQ